MDNSILQHAFEIYGPAYITFETFSRLKITQEQQFSKICRLRTTNQFLDELNRELQELQSKAKASDKKTFVSKDLIKYVYKASELGLEQEKLETLVKNVCLWGDAETAVQLLELMDKLNMKPSHVVYENLFQCFERTRDTYQARLWFEKYQETNKRMKLGPLHAFMRVLAVSGEGVAAMDVLTRIIPQSGFSANTRAFNSLLKSFVRSNDTEYAQQLFDIYQDQNVEPDKETYTFLCLNYCFKNEFDKALEAYQKADLSILFTWESGFFGRLCLKNGRKDLAEEILSSMIAQKRIDTAFLVSILESNGSQAFDQSLSLMQRLNFKLDQLTKKYLDFTLLGNAPDLLTYFKQMESMSPKRYYPSFVLSRLVYLYFQHKNKNQFLLEHDPSFLLKALVETSKDQKQAIERVHDLLMRLVRIKKEPKLEMHKQLVDLVQRKQFKELEYRWKQSMRKYLKEDQIGPLPVLDLKVLELLEERGEETMFQSTKLMESKLNKLLLDGSQQEILSSLSQLMDRKIVLQTETISKLADYCAKENAADRILHLLMKTIPKEQQPSVYTLFAERLKKKPLTSARIAQRMAQELNLLPGDSPEFVWNLLPQLNDPELVELLFRKTIELYSLVPPAFVWKTMIKTYYELELDSQLQDIVQFTVDRQIQIEDDEGYYLESLCRTKSPKAMQQFAIYLEQVKKPRHGPFHQVMKLESDPRTRIHFWELAQQHGLKPNQQTLSLLLEAYAVLGEQEQISQLLKQAREDQLLVTADHYASILRGMEKNLQKMCLLLEEMRQMGVKPNKSVYEIILEQAINQKDVFLAEHLKAEMLQHFEPSLEIEYKHLELLLKLGNVQEAERLFKRLQSQNMDLVFYNLMIRELRRLNRPEASYYLNLLREKESVYQI
ncbi:hypothetical protein EDD86DRAFT_204225 [Gorgonomyces haynaldii]|nr:hypothetical protein EDD86DRAFT_204225 [Gorgonomyces haynaldii]